MALREKFGRLVLLEETEVSALGREFRAARLGPGGLDRLVNVVCFAAPVSSHAAATKRLMDEARLAARLQNPGLVRVLGIGRVEQTFYVSTELVEGRNLTAILERCVRDNFPLAADHALMIASRAASALEYLHAKKDDSGKGLLHGLLSPSRVTVAFDGEVKLKGLGLWAALREADLLAPADRCWLAPEQAAGPGEPRSDVFALGLVLLKALTGQEPPAGDPAAALADARVVNVSGESSPLPKPLAELLCRALARDAGSRFPNMAEMRKAIDTLLFSGDFTPTTFDLAFFMHTLFREEMESESRAIEEARRADYREFVDDKPSGPITAPPAFAPPTVALPETGAPEAPAQPAAPPSIQPPGPEPAVSAQTASGKHRPAPHAEPAPRRAPEPAASAETAAFSAEETAAADATPGPHGAARSGREVPPVRLGAAPSSARSRTGILIGIGLVLVAVAGGVGWWYVSRSRASTATAPPTTLTPEAQAALARVRELETRIAQLEKDKAEAETKAAEDARRKLEAQAAARGRAVDPAAVQKAQEEARVRARAEQEKKQQEELARIAEQRRLEEKRIAEASPTPTPAGTATPADAAAAPPATVPAASAPVVFATPPVAIATPIATPLASAGPAQPAAPPRQAQIINPVLVGQTPARYPPLAEARRIPGTVELTALVDETGRVVEVRVVKVSPARLGFEEAASEHARSRRYQPATRDGVPIRTIVPIVVTFKPR